MLTYLHLLFDLDGTLTDPLRGLIGGVKYALRQFGIEESDDDSLRRFIGPPLVESFQSFYAFSPAQAGAAVEYYKEYYGPTGLFESTVYPGIPETLQRLKAAGFHLLVATCKPEPFAVRQLEHFGLASFFDCISGGGMDESSTKQEVVTNAIRRGGITDCSRVLMVGDRKFDILGAKQCGIADSIGVLYGYGSREELEEAGAQRFAETPAQIADLIMTPQTE